MKLRRIMALGLSVVMMTSLLAGCGSTDTPETESKAESTEKETQTQAASTQESSVEEEVDLFSEFITYTALAPQPNTFTYNGDGNLGMAAFKEHANIEIEFTEIKNEELKEKGNLLITSESYPDILFKCGALDLYGYGTEGILIPLEDLIREYMPNLTAILDERNGWYEIASPDGHVYSLPTVLRPIAENQSYLMIQSRWLENVGMELPTTMDEFYEVMKAFKEQDANGNGDPNDEIPYTGSGSPRGVFYPLLDDGIHYANNCVIVDGELEYYPLSENYRTNYLEYMVKMWDEGLFDQNLFTQGSSESRALMASGDVVGASCESSLNNWPEETALEYVGVYPFNGNPYPLTSGVGTGGFAVTDKCEHVEELLARWDYMYTEEGARLGRLGVEGESYELTNGGENYKYIYNDKELSLWQCIWTGYANPPMLYPDLYFLGTDPEGSPKDAHYENGRYDSETGVYAKNYYLLPTLKYTEDESKTLSTLGTDISTYISTWEAQVITGEIVLDDKAWNEFQDTLKAMDVDKIVEIYKASYARAIAE